MIVVAQGHRPLSKTCGSLALAPRFRNQSGSSRLLLRQQLPSTVRVHDIVTSGGEAPNAIPQRTEDRWYVRAKSLAELAEIEPRVRRCFEAGAA